MRQTGTFLVAVMIVAGGTEVWTEWARTKPGRPGARHTRLIAYHQSRPSLPASLLGPVALISDERNRRMDGMDGLDENKAVLATFSLGAGEGVCRAGRVLVPRSG